MPSELTNDILDSLDSLGFINYFSSYSESIFDNNLYEKAINLGPKSLIFTEIIQYLTKGLSELCSIDEYVRSIKDEQDSDTFLMELSSFLREFDCPYTCLINGPIPERLKSVKNCEILLDYLCTELQALRMTAVNNFELLPTFRKFKQDSNPFASEIKDILITSNISMPPKAISIQKVFQKIDLQIKPLISKYGCENLLSKPLLKSQLTEKHVNEIGYINSLLKAEYELRMDMLMKRIDVTVQSFLWSDQAKLKQSQISQIFEKFCKMQRNRLTIDLHHLLSAREDLLVIQKTSSGSDREKTSCQLNRILIGKVPDRGGRAYEHDIPPIEMPAFKSRQSGSSDRGGNRGRGSFHSNKTWNKDDRKQGNFKAYNNPESSNKGFFGDITEQNYQAEFQSQGSQEYTNQTRNNFKKRGGYQRRGYH